jgi:predicted transcriptional regulator
MPEQSLQSCRGMAARIVAAYVQHHRLSPDQIAPLIPTVYGALSTAENQAVPTLSAVQIRGSVHRDHLVCLECGFAATSLPLHLKAAHGLTPDQYRAKWQLPAAYPMVSPAYSKHRSMLAKKFGLGRKVGRRAHASEETRPVKVSKRRSRRATAR